LWIFAEISHEEIHYFENGHSLNIKTNKKLAVIEENESTTITEVYAEARLNVKGMLNIIILSLMPGNSNIILFILQALHMECFLSLDQPDAKSLKEIYQYKHKKNDFFILFATSILRYKTSKRFGIVD
ncbi:18511_t:CDS:2, partial [Acaulospora morrowiae]